MRLLAAATALCCYYSATITEIIDDANVHTYTNMLMMMLMILK